MLEQMYAHLTNGPLDQSRIADLFGDVSGPYTVVHGQYVVFEGCNKEVGDAITQLIVDKRAVVQPVEMYAVMQPVETLCVETLKLPTLRPRGQLVLNDTNPFLTFILTRCNRGGKVSRADFMQAFNNYLDSIGKMPVTQLKADMRALLLQNRCEYNAKHGMIKGVSLR